MIAVGIIAALVFSYAVVSGRLARSPVSGPMVFAAAGLVLSDRLLGWVPVVLEEEVIRILLEVTLALVLFTDATEVRLRSLRQDAPIDARLLLIGLPLCMAVGTVAAVLVFTDLSVWEAAAVGVLLAPTDAALGQAVVSNGRVPERIREALNVESGLNDGLAVPVFMLVLAAAEAEFTADPALVVRIGFDLLIAAAIGAVLGAGAGRLVRFAASRGVIGTVWRPVLPAALAIVCYVVGDEFGASGFIAAFLGGVFFGREIRGLDDFGVFSEGAAHLLTMMSFFVFGSAILAPLIDTISWRFVVYAALSLTVIRMLPVVVSLVRSNLAPPTQLYLAWFGPRGLASIVFASTVVIETDLPGTETILGAMSATVVASVVAHGVTAWWGSNQYADWCAVSAERTPDMPEMAGVAHPTRRSRMPW